MSRQQNSASTASLCCSRLQRRARSHGRGLRSFVAGVLLAVLMILPGASAVAEETPAGTSLRAILEQQQRQTLQAVLAYLEKNPQASDRGAAIRWVLETAAAGGLETEAGPFARKLLSSPADASDPVDAELRALARPVVCLEQARAGNMDAARELFDETIRSLGLRQSQKALTLAHRLSAAARVKGQLDAARSVYERVGAAFPLAPQVEEIAQARLARMELIGQPAVNIVAPDQNNQTVDLAGLKGKVVILDFWATNCPPCLAEMPNLKSLATEKGPAGLEIVGVSFDENADDARNYFQQTGLPWRTVMNQQSGQKLSESFRVRMIPSLFVLDRKGVIRQVDVVGADLRETVEQLLKEGS